MTAGRVPAESVLVAGLPRSGTTWIGRVLGLTEGAVYIHEPDNHLVRPDAWWAKRELGAYPALVPGDEAPEYERLWQGAFAGGPPPPLLEAGARLLHRCVPRARRRRPQDDRDRAGHPAATGTFRLAGALAARREPPEARRHTVVKSVFCARSLEWLAERFGPRVVVVTRHPFAVIGSWYELGWNTFLDGEPRAVAECRAVHGVEPPARDGPWIDRAAWHYAFLAAALERAVAHHPEWWVIPHEDLCADPVTGFGELCGALGLAWTDEAERFLTASNRPGRGYSTNRLWAEQLGTARRRLSPPDEERVAEALVRFRERRPQRAWRPGAPTHRRASSSAITGRSGRAK